LKGVERMLDAHNATSMLCAQVREDRVEQTSCDPVVTPVA
jgi:hypothetical protein